MPKQRNWEKCEEAKTMRLDGKTFKEIGEKLGVSAETASSLVWLINNRDNRRRAEAKNQRIIPWHDGLSLEAVRMLKNAGIESKESCLFLCKDNLPIFWSSVVLPGWQRDRKYWGSSSQHRIPFKVANEVRNWLGVSPIKKEQQIRVAKEKRDWHAIEGDYA